MKSTKGYKYSPKHIYSTFFPLYLASTLLGLSPLSTRTRHGRREIFHSKFPVARTLIFAVLYVSVLCYFLYVLELLHNVLCRIRFYQDLFSVLLYFCEIVAGCLAAKKIVDVLNNIDDVDEMLQSLKIYIPYKPAYLKIIIYIVFAFFGVIITLVVFVTTDTFLICYSSYANNILMETCAYSLPFMANFLMELQYFQYLNILRSRYKELNQCLLKDIDLMPSTVGFEKISTITKVHPKSLKQAKSCDPLYTINQVTKIHMILTDTARLVNRAFCFQQLLKIAISFVSIVTGLFLFAMVFAIKDPSRLRIDILFLLWTFSNAIEMFVVVWISAETCEEANKCPIILHRIRNSTTNEGIKNLVDLYSLQMYHSKLAFNVCGLLPLDYSLLYSVVAGATTYLVILIQFSVDIVKAYDNGIMP